MMKILYIIFIALLTGCNSSNTSNHTTYNVYSYPKSIKKLIIHETNSTYRSGEGAFLKIKNNSLAYVYTCFYKGSSDSSPSDICIIRSDDKERKIWSKPEILIKNHGKKNIMSVSLVRISIDKILIQYLEKNSCNDLRIVRRYSYDELMSVTSEIEYLSNRGYNVVNNDRILKYKNYIFTPVSKHSCDVENNIFDYNGTIELYISSLLDNTTEIKKISTDNNITYQEPGIVNLTDDSLMMWFRNSSKKMYISKSNNLGKNFSKPKPSILNTVPFSPSSIKNYNGDLFIVYNKFDENNTKKKRTPLVLSISRDGLETINREYILENNESDEYMYSAIIRDNDDLIIAYMVSSLNLNTRIIKIEGIFK